MPSDPTDAGGQVVVPFYEDDAVTIYCGDVLDVLSAGVLPLVDLVITSPPYNLSVTAGGGFGHYVDDAGMRQRSGGGKWTGGALANGYDGHDDAMPMHEYEAWQQDVLASLWSYLGPAGAIFYNHKPRINAGTLWLPLRLNPMLPLRQIITWARAGGMNFAPTHYVPTYEWVMVLAKPDFRLKSKGASGVGDVWRIPQETGIDHPCPFPVGLPARIIETTGPSLVLDPFMGSGSTLVAAKAAGVRVIGIEKSARYCELAIKRLAQGSLFEVGA